MDIFTAEQKNLLPELYSEDGTDLPCLVRFYAPDNIFAHLLSFEWVGWSWYIIQRGTGDMEGILLGIVDGFEIEMGSVSEKELAFGISKGIIVRDDTFTPTMFSEIRKYHTLHGHLLLPWSEKKS